MRSKTSDAKLINLFLDMLAAEQGAGDNTLDAYRGDLEDFSEFAGRAKSGFAAADTHARETCNGGTNMLVVWPPMISMVNSPSEAC